MEAFISMMVKPLAKIDFPKGLEGTEGLPFSRRALVNMFYAAGKVIQRPGLSLLSNTTGVARGAFDWNGSMYTVASGSLLKITDAATGSFSVIGSIAGTNPVVTAVGFNTAVILVKGGNGYTLDKSDVLTQMVSPQFVPCNAVTHINGRFIYIPSDGDPGFFSDVGSADTIQTTSFFDAEQLPDKNTETFNFNNILYIGGEDSIEAYFDRGLEPVPFIRQTGRVDNGIIGGLLEYGGSYLFVGREKGQDLGIYVLGQGNAPKLSNEYIDTILATYTIDELSQCVSGRLKYRGYDVAKFDFVRHSFGYYAGNWFQLDTLVNGEPEPWQGGYIQQFEGKYYSFYSDKIGLFDSTNRDYGNPFVKVIDFGFEQDGSFSLQSLQLNLSQGFNDEIGSVALGMSDDNILYGPYFHNNTGGKGDYMQKLQWDYPGGLGLYDTFLGFRFSSGEDIDMSATSVDMDIR